MEFYQVRAESGGRERERGWRWMGERGSGGEVWGGERDWGRERGERNEDGEESEEKRGSVGCKNRSHWSETQSS